jgi:hypothetical protein
MELEKALTLRKPVKLGDVEFTELKLCEPTAGQLEKATRAATTSTGVVIELVSIVAKVPRKVAEDLCQRDFSEATDFFGQFSGFLPDGGTPSPT